MEIFKKEDVTLPLFQQVTQRVIATFKENISFRKKEYRREFCEIFFPSLVASSVLAYAAIFLYGMKGNDFWILLSATFSLMSVFSGIVSIGSLIVSCYTFRLLKKSLTEMTHYQDKYYNNFNHLLDTDLNSEEIQHLFSLSLRPTQREFLEKIIKQQKNICLSDLAKLPLVLSEEEEAQLRLARKQKEIEDEQQNLIDFFEKHQISSPSLTQAEQLQLMTQSNNEKEIKLSSLL